LPAPVFSKLLIVGSSSGQDGYCYDFIIDISIRFDGTETTKPSAEKLIEYVLDSDPNCYRALRTMVDINQVDKIHWLKEVVRVGNDKNATNLWYYAALLEDSRGPAESEDHALKIAYHQLRGPVKKKFSRSYIDCDLQNKEILVHFDQADVPSYSELYASYRILHLGAFPHYHHMSDHN
jgi:hypothetical protein